MDFLHLNRVDENTVLGAISGGTDKFNQPERKNHEQNQIQKAVQRTDRRGLRNDENPR